MTELTVSLRRSRLSLVMLIGVFAAPVLLAWAVFYLFPDWRPGETVNHGELVEPVRPLPRFELPVENGAPVDRDFLRGKWTFVYLANGACGEDCVRDLYKIRQVRLSQGKDMSRLQRLMLWSADSVNRQKRKELAEHFPGMVVALLGQRDRPLVERFSRDGSSAPTPRCIYLVDPLGNLMMRYEPDADPRGMMKDLHRLLKYSGLG